MNESEITQLKRNRKIAVTLGASLCLALLSFIYSYIKVNEQRSNIQKMEGQLQDCRKLAERQMEEARMAIQLALDQSQMAREQALKAKKIADEQMLMAKQAERNASKK